MILKYYGHSCFTISSGEYTLAIDPYDDKVPGYPPLKIRANAVYCSHGHGDHCNLDAVEIVPASCEDPFTVTEISIPHDREGGAMRGMNLIRIFEAEGKKIIHFGDTGCMPSEEILSQLKGADAALIPVGGFFTIEASEAKKIAELITPKTVIPMHYKEGPVGLSKIAEIGEFLDLCKDSSLNIRKMAYLEETGI